MAASALIRRNHERAQSVRSQFEATSGRQLVEDGVLLTSSILIACLCAGLVIRHASRLHAQMQQQANELSRVSWQLLEKQEHLARRLSHELHDELGQSLTALKTNFSRVTPGSAPDPAWLDDCSELLRDSIRSAHEISQLLRPTILDDFGLDSALAWLCERFEERNRMEVHYRSSIRGRLDPQSETHVFRIAQEALTNVARHARASRVEMLLERQGGEAILRVRDNGIGVSMSETSSGSARFGLTGMRARARSLHGEMTLRHAEGGGAEVEIRFPWKEMAREEEDTHLVGR
ncbi:MAG: sensor histidine kinase, partial [Bryobacteraceae bacterium]|nr:sensor histidine kinase [Bryobacteraceae bacterium]